MTASIAFFAPMKPAAHPVPSGDREMARALLAALGEDAEPVSALRIYDGAGDPLRQAELLAAAIAERDRLIARLRGRARIWVSYHNYYKAPDLIGPETSRALSIPYVLIESSRARSRLTGPWSGFAAAAEAASDAAAAIFYLTEQDREALERDRPPGQRLIHLSPFLPLSDLPPASAAEPETGPILVAGMMRGPDKTASYRLVADTLAQIADLPWQVEIAGDGPARAEVEAMMARFGPRVRFLGLLDRDGMAAAYRRARLFFWPGVNEAYGMVYLEAQARGLPVLAQDRPGVRDVLAPGNRPSPADGAGALARELAALLGDPARRLSAGAAARAHVGAEHLLTSARATLRAGLAGLAR